MYYKMLSHQYLKEAEILRAYVKNLRSVCAGSRNRRGEIDYRITMLYGMYLELKHTGEYLNHKCEVICNEK